MLPSPTPTGHFSSLKFPHIVQRSFLSLITLSLLTGTLAAQSTQDAPKLEVGKPIERELAGDAAHSYSITLAANQFLSVVVEQKGIDIVVTLFAPDGKKAAEVDSPNGTQGPEPVLFIAETAGSYRLEVRSLEAKAAAGKYQVKMEELRAATKQDRDRLTVTLLFAEAELLRDAGTAASLRQSIQKYDEALPLFRSLGDSSSEATTLHNIGLVYSRLGDKQKALDYYARALPIRHTIEDQRGEAQTLNNIGRVYDDLGEKRKALDYFAQALSLWRTSHDRDGEATTLQNIGTVYNHLGEKQKAFDYFSQALVTKRAVGDQRGEALVLNSIGFYYDEQGEKQKALESYSQALVLQRKLGDLANQAVTLNNIGKVYSNLGEKQKALDYYAQTLLLMRTVGDRTGEATTLSNIGLVYHDLGENQKALDYYAQALPLRRVVGDRRGEAATLNNIAGVYLMLGENRKALDYFGQALLLRRAVNDRFGEGITLHNIGSIYEDLGEKQKALDYYTQALQLRRSVSDRKGEGVTLNNIGRVYDGLGEKQKALDYYTQALLLLRAVGDRKGEALTLLQIAGFERQLGRLSEARTRIEDAISIIESLRTKIGSQELRASFFSTMQSFYMFYIDLLMQMHKRQPLAGNDKVALQASERARARALLEMLAEANADIRRGVEPALLERERSLREQLNAKAERQMRILGSKHTEEQAQAIAIEIEALTTKFQEIEAQIKQSSPRYAALTQPQPLSLKEIQTQVLDQDTLLLEYSLGAARSYLWAVTPDSITTYELPGRAEIETLARSVYALFTDAGRWRTRSADGQRLLTMEEEEQRAASQAEMKKLSRMLLAPVAAQLGRKRLVVIADGALQYIPFGALPVPAANITRKQANAYHPLIIKHEVISLPSASTLAVIRKEVQGRAPAAKTVAVLADPVFESNDERVSQAVKMKAGLSSKSTSSNGRRELLPPGLERSAGESGLSAAELKIPRLPGTRAEARQILSLVPPAQSMEAFDFAANRKAAMSDELSQYRYLHFATHGFLNSAHPELSGLVFSMVDEKGQPQDGFLRAHEIFNLKLPAELVVLSACQTGLGKEIKGEGLVGLTRGFMYAGSPRVVVSLWSVSDQATAELMTRFYRGILKGGLRPAAALRAAQVSLMKEKKWEAPFYWAAFTLQGEWK